MFKTELVLAKVKGRSNKYRVVRPLVFDSGIYGFFTVPIGFTTDLSTFWLEGRHTEAAVIHDFALETGQGRARANEIMYIAMKDLNVPWLYRRTIFTGVTLFGWWAEIKRKF